MSLVSSGPRKVDDGHPHAFTAVCLLCGGTAQECGYVFERVVIHKKPTDANRPSEAFDGT